MDTKKKKKKISPYMVFSTIVIILLAIAFAFPLYWILTGSFKTQVSINSTTPEWWPSEWVMTNYDKLFSRQKSPLWEFAVPFSSHFSADGKDIIWWAGPQVPAAVRWLINTVFMAVASMILTCITSAMAGYALAKKRFVGRSILFTLIVCAMALPKQVILIPLLREMSSLQLYNTIWAVIFPIVGWPFGVFLMKQFSEGIPGEMLEAARIDGASEAKTFVRIALPMIKPGIGALAIFTFINSWNDYFMQLIMLSSTSKLTISLGDVYKRQAEYCFARENERIRVLFADCCTLAGLEERAVAYLQDIAANRMGDYKMIAQALGTPGKCESVPACADELRDIMHTLLIRLQAAGEIDPAVSLEYCCTAIFSAVVGGLIGLCFTAECGIQSGLPENLKMLLHRTLQVQQ